MVPDNGIPEQASHWVEFRNQVKGIKPTLCTTWVAINGVPNQKGVTKAVNWRDVLSSGVSSELEAIKLRDPDYFLVGGTNLVMTVYFFLRSLSLNLVLNSKSSCFNRSRLRAFNSTCSTFCLKKTRQMHLLDSCHPLILNCRPRPLQQ